MIEIVPYEAKHLEQLRLRPEQAGELPNQIGTEAITFVREGQVLAILGWYLIMPGVMQIWSLISEEAKHSPLAFHRACKLLIEYGFKKHGLRRMQISVRCGFETGWRWAKALGFKCEGIMKQYGPGGLDCWLYARTL